MNGEKKLCKICGDKLRFPATRCMTCETETCKACLLSEEWIHYENRCANKDCTGSVFSDMTHGGAKEPQYFQSIWDINPKSGYLPPDQARKKIFERCIACNQMVAEPTIKQHYAFECLELPQFCRYCHIVQPMKKMMVHQQLTCPTQPVKCPKCQTFFVRATGHECTSELSLQSMLKKAQTDALAFELQLQQVQTRCSGLEIQIKETTDMNIRLREAVEELERRLQTNYERTALLGVKGASDGFIGSAPGIGALGGNPEFYNIDESNFTFTRARDEEIDDNPEQLHDNNFETEGMKAADAAKLDMFAELDAIDEFGEMTYHEKHAFNLEHLAGITCLTYLRLPNFMFLLEMGQTNSCQERLGFFFASGDSFGCVKVWEVDRRASLLTFNFKEEQYQEFDAGPPPKVYGIVQVKHYLVAVLAHEGQPGSIQVWDMLSKKDITCVIDAHSQEITCITNYFGHPGSQSIEQNKETQSSNPLECSVFVTAGNDQSVKVWEVYHNMVRQLYVVQLSQHVISPNMDFGNNECVISMVCYEMDKYKNCLVVFTEARRFYIIKLLIKNSEDHCDKTSQLLTVERHEVVMKFPSKHLAHTLIQLGEDRLVTVSENSFEHWDLVREKRKKLVSTNYGQMFHACKLTEPKRKGMEPKLLACEDSRILRMFSMKRYIGRILSRHNDCVRRMLKVPGKHLIITAADDGSIKCQVGRRHTQPLLNAPNLTMTPGFAEEGCDWLN